MKLKIPEQLTEDDFDVDSEVEFTEKRPFLVTVQVDKKEKNYLQI